MFKSKDKVIFGGDKPWTASDWTASDDRVRGGKSQSYLEISDSGSSARFHGHLDIQTLGGAGFASQRTVAEDATWDLSGYDGILLDLGKSDGKRYTFILKDELLPKNPDNGREQATISWEYDFSVAKHAQAESAVVFIPWKDLRPTYRGKEKKDAGKLDTKNVKRFSIMMRSFFGDQEGDFSLSVRSVKAVSRPADLEKGPYSDENMRDKRGMAVFRAPLLMAVLLLTVLAYVVCKYVCPWVTDSRAMRHWGW